MYIILEASCTFNSLCNTFHMCLSATLYSFHDRNLPGESDNSKVSETPGLRPGWDWSNVVFVVRWSFFLRPLNIENLSHPLTKAEDSAQNSGIFPP